MRRAIRTRHFWVCVGLFCCFWLFTLFLTNKITLLLTNSLLMAVSAAVGIAYIPVAWDAMRNVREPEIQHIAIGISLSWSFSSLWRIWSLFWLMTGAGPDYSFLIQNDVIAMFQSGIALGAFYHLTSPGALGPDRPRRKWIVIGGVIGAGLGVTALLAYYTPNSTAQAIARAVEPYIPR